MGPDLPLDLVPCKRGGPVAAKVVVDPGSPKVGAREAVLQSFVDRDDADSAGPALKDRVAHHELFEQVAEGPHLAHDGLRLGDPALRQVFLETTDAVVVRMETSARRRLDQVEDVLAVTKCEEHRRDRTELYTHVADPERDVGDSRQFEQDGADPLRTRRRLHVHELLRGEDEGHLVGKAAEPVDAVDQRGDLRVGTNLGELLVATMHVTHDRFAADDLLRVEPGHETQRAVRGRVLRTHVERHALVVDEVDVDPHVGGLGRDVGGLTDLFTGGRERGADRSRFRRRHSRRHQASTSSGSASPEIGSTLMSPGQGFTSRASSGKSLRSGKPSNAPGR